MAYLLRKLDNKRHWDKSPHENEAWLNDDVARADALRNLRTTDNSLSMFRIDESEHQVERVLAALASTSTKGHIDPVDYACIKESEIINIGVKLHDVLGDTPDDFVNSLHVDLIELTSDKISELAKLSIKLSTSKRLNVKKVKKLIKANIDSGNIDQAKVPEGILKHFIGK